MGKKSWAEFSFYLLRVIVLLVLLAVLLPRLAGVWHGWMSSLINEDKKPSGNPMKVEEPSWNRFVIKLFPN